MKRNLFFTVLFMITTMMIQAETLRVMSFNIRYNNPGDGVNAWPNRKENVADMINKIHKVDIAGLQEVLHGQLMDLDSLLPDTYSFLGVGRDNGLHKGEYSCIVYRNDKFEVLATNTFWLAENTEVPGMVSWDSSLTRIVTWAKFKEIATGEEFFFFNTHFDHRGRQARVESAKLIVHKTKSIAGDAPTIITGDFNARESSPPYAVLSGKEPAGDLKSDLKDGRYVSKNGHEGPTTTSSGWNQLRDPETKIDYIFVRNNVEVLTHKVLVDKFGEYYPSDHLPVFATVNITD